MSWWQLSLRREPPRVAGLEHAQRQVGRAARRRRPVEPCVHRALQPVQLGRVANEQVQPGLESVDPMNEQAEVDGRIPGHRVPGHRAPARWQFDAWHHPREHPVEALGRDRRPAVAGQQASPLQDDLSGQRARRRSARRFALEHRRFERVEPLRLAGRFARGDGDFVDDLPAHRVVAAEPVRGAMPARSSQLVREGRIEVARNSLHAGPPVPGEVGRPDHQHGIRVLALGAREVLGPVQPEQVFDRLVGQAMQQPSAPAQGRGGDPQRADRVSRVMLAIAECALAVLPRLAPVDRREPDQKGLRRESAHQRREQRHAAVRSPFEPVLARRVVVQARSVAKPGQRVDQQVALGRMQVAARRIAAQRPARGAGLLPGGDGQRVLQQARQRADRERRARHRTATVQVVVAGRQRLLRPAPSSGRRISGAPS